jgi:hypothetical protein
MPDRYGLSGTIEASMWIAEASRRLRAWWNQEPEEPYYRFPPLFGDGDDLPDAHADIIERPWRHRWDHLPKRCAGFGFTGRDYDAARIRAEEVARLTVGEAVWARLKRHGYVDLPSRRYPGITYRLRVGRRIEVRCKSGVPSPWRHRFLCINPAYPLPEAEFFAHLYLYVRDHEDEVIRVAAPQPADQALGRTF